MKVRMVFPLVTLLFAITLAACGIGVNAAKPTPTPDPQKAMLAFTQCMRDHGVDLPDPGTASGPVKITVDPATMDAAENACKSLRKGLDGKAPSAAEQARMRDQLIKFSQCMRAHGINIPDPTFSGNGATVRVGPGDSTLDPSSAEFQAAQTACEKNMPKGTFSSSGPGGGGSGSGGSGLQVQSK